VSKHKSLFNTLTVVAGIIFAVQGIFSHNIYLKVFNIIGLFFLLFALHSELKNIYGKKFRFVSAVITCLIIVLFILDPLSKLEEGESQKHIYALQNSVAALKDSLNKYQTHFAIAETVNKFSNQKLALAKTYFNSTSKPILWVDNITIDTLLPNKQITAHCKIENTGNAKANKMTWFMGSSLRSVRYYNGSFFIGKFLKAPPLAPHKSFLATSVSVDLLPQQVYDDLQSRKWFIYYYGIVYYYDDFGIKDSIVFCYFHDGTPLNDFTYDTSYSFQYK
jgi:hypothetical protein